MFMSRSNGVSVKEGPDARGFFFGLAPLSACLARHTTLRALLDDPARESCHDI